MQDLEQPQLTHTYTIADPADSISAMTYLIGDRTLIIGTKAGSVSGVDAHSRS